MSSFNKVIFLGRLTRDPELRVTANGHNICKFGLAASRKFKGADGILKEEVVFIDVDTFGKQAEVIAKYFSKGKPIFVEGRLRLDQWESANGEKRSKHVVVLENFQFIGGREEGVGEGSAVSTGYEQVSPPSRTTNEGSSQPASTGAAVAVKEGLDEDVPF